MHVTHVHIHVKQDCIDDFIKATRDNHAASIREDGNRRFDVLQNAEDPARFVLYEWFSSDQSANAHKQTEHYLTWRETIAPMMAEPRNGARYVGLYPEF